MSHHTHETRISPMHAGAGIYWTIATLATVANIWWGGDLPWWVDILNMLAFIIPEAWALRYRKEISWEGRAVALRDTLSEYMTWVARMSPLSSTRWYQAWNGLVVLLAGHWSALPARQTDALSLNMGELEISLAALGVWLMMMGFLVYHWLRPDTKG